MMVYTAESMCSRPIFYAETEYEIDASREALYLMRFDHFVDRFDYAHHRASSWIRLLEDCIYARFDAMRRESECSLDT